MPVSGIISFQWRRDVLAIVTSIYFEVHALLGFKYKHL